MPGPPQQRPVEVGRITGVFGVRGWVRIFSYTDPPPNILHYGPWLVGERGEVRRLVDGAAHGKGVVARLEGVTDRDTARSLVGATISVPRAALGKPSGRQYFWADLIGLRVINDEGVDLGQVVDLMETGANDVLVVVRERRRLVPFVAGSVVRSVDPDAGLIHVVWEEDF